MTERRKADKLVRGLRLIESGHWHGLGDEWLKKTGGAGAAEIERLRAALNDIVNPMDVLRRRAEAEGAVLNHMAHGIAHSPGFLRDIAQSALEQSAREEGK